MSSATVLCSFTSYEPRTCWSWTKTDITSFDPKSKESTVDEIWRARFSQFRNAPKSSAFCPHGIHWQVLATQWKSTASSLRYELKLYSNIRRNGFNRLMNIIPARRQCSMSHAARARVCRRIARNGFVRIIPSSNPWKVVISTKKYLSA
jgi:hypothetical protein